VAERQSYVLGHVRHQVEELVSVPKLFLFYCTPFSQVTLLVTHYCNDSCALKATKIKTAANAPRHAGNIKIFPSLLLASALFSGRLRELAIVAVGGSA